MKLLLATPPNSTDLAALLVPLLCDYPGLLFFLQKPAEYCKQVEELIGKIMTSVVHLP